MKIMSCIKWMQSRFFFILFFSTLFLPFKTLAYTPPIGIPDPGMWGTTHPIDSSAPSTATKCPGWPISQTDNCYYIDNTHAQATDSGNTYGYPNKPRLTIPQTTFLAGSYIEIHGGMYTSKNYSLTFAGTAEAPIWIRGASADEMPIVTGQFLFRDSSYVILENIDFNGGFNGSVNGVENPRIFEGGWPGGCISFTRSNVNHIAIRNCKFRHKARTVNTAAVSNSQTAGGSHHDFVIHNNLFYLLGDWQDNVGDADFHGVNPSLWGIQASKPPQTSTYNWWILNNTGYNISGNLVQVNAGPWGVDGDQGPPGNRPYLHHIYIGKNIAHHNRQSGFASKMASDVIISQNKTYGNFKASLGEGTGIVYQYNPTNLWIIFNEVSDITNGIRQSAILRGNEGYPVYIIGNIIHDVSITPPDLPYNVFDGYKLGAAIPFWHGDHKRYVVDNTTHNSFSGITVAANGINGSTTVCSGNVFSNIAKTDDFHITAISQRESTHFNYTFFQPNADGKVRVKWGATLESLEAFKTTTGECQNCWEGDPLFVNPVNNDFHPQEGSPLIGKGIRHPVYDEFLARYGINIAVDFDGKPRPLGSWTLGALEPGTLTTSLPSPTAPNASIIK